MDYEKKYKDNFELARDWYNDQSTTKKEKVLLENLFPELAESEDERIRKAIVSFIDEMKGDFDSYEDIKLDEMVAWLEKQGEQKPNYCHHEVDLSECSEEYRKAYYDGWNNCNMQHSQCKSELDDVVKCLINGMKFYYEDNEKATWGTDKWSMPVKHIIEVLEKQCEQKPDKVEPKFKVGDWVVNKLGDVWHIDSFDKKNYQVSDGKGNYNYFPISKQGEMYLWTIQDAKDGDVLVYGDNPNGHHVEVIMIFKSLRNKLSAFTHFHIFNNEFRTDNWCDCGKNAHPASKEQRSLLFQKMKVYGYEWNADKKELKKL